MLTDIDIAQRAKLLPIGEIAGRLGIPAEALEPYGHTKAKVSLDWLASLAERPNGKLILVSAISPDAGGRRQDHDHGGPGRRAEPDRQEGGGLPARAFARAGLRHEGRRRRRRLRAGRADGGHQPAFHRRLPRDRRRQQPARRADRQPHPPRQRARHRRASRRVEARPRHERPRAARNHRRARRSGQRLSAPGRLRHRRGVRSDGDLLPVGVARRPQGAAGQDRRRLHARPEARPRARPAGARRDDGAAQGRAEAEPRADAREQPGVHPRRPLRQHRARLQLGDRDQGRAEARRLRGHRSGIRRGPGRGEVHRHQMPQVRAAAEPRRAGRDDPCAQIPRRRRRRRSSRRRICPRWKRASPTSSATSTTSATTTACPASSRSTISRRTPTPRSRCSGRRSPITTRRWSSPGTGRTAARAPRSSRGRPSR